MGCTRESRDQNTTREYSDDVDFVLKGEDGPVQGMFSYYIDTVVSY